MKFLVLAATLLIGVEGFALEQLTCKDIINSNRIYEIRPMDESDESYSVVVLESGRAIYSEPLQYLDWQGVAQYSGQNTIITIGEDPDGYAEVVHSGIFLKSTKLDCGFN